MNIIPQGARRGKVYAMTFTLPCLWEVFYSAKFYKEVKNMAKVEMKQPVITEISEKIKNAQAVVLVDYRGLTVAQDTELRKALRAEGVTYKIYKNTMMKRAFEGTDFAQMDDMLNGPSAMAVSETDPAAPARILCDFAKKNDALQVKGGVCEGRFFDENTIKEIASIPPRDQLLSRLLGSVQSPITNFARVAKQIAEKNPEEAPAAEATEAPAEEAPAAE